MRTIDADGLKKAFEEDGHLSSYIEEFIDEAPTIVSEPTPSKFRRMAIQMGYAQVVHCRDCKYNYNRVLNHEIMLPRCDFTDRTLTEGDFCSRGEK